eukprot:Pgem_evm1s344
MTPKLFYFFTFFKTSLIFANSSNGDNNINYINNNIDKYAKIDGHFVHYKNTIPNIPENVKIQITEAYVHLYNENHKPGQKRWYLNPQRIGYSTHEYVNIVDNKTYTAPQLVFNISKDDSKEILLAPWKIEEEQAISLVTFLNNDDKLAEDSKFHVIEPPLIHSIAGTQVLQNRWHEISFDSTFHDRDESLEIMIVPYDVTQTHYKHTAGEEHTDAGLGLDRFKDIKKYLLRPIRINILKDMRDTMLCDKPYIPATVKRTFPVCNVEEVDRDDKNKWCEKGFFQDKFKTETVALEVKSVFCDVGSNFQPILPTIVATPELPLIRYTHDNYDSVYDHLPYFQYFHDKDKEYRLRKGDFRFHSFRNLANVTISAIPDQFLTQNAIHKITNRSDKVIQGKLVLDQRVFEREYTYRYKTSMLGEHYFLYLSIWKSNVNDFGGKPQIIEGSEFEFDMESFNTERINEFNVTIPTKNANIGDSFYVQFTYQRAAGASDEDVPRIGLFQVVSSDETCLAGYICDESLDNSIAQCPKGFYCQNGVKNQCPNGFIAENVGQEKCTACAT